MDPSLAAVLENVTRELKEIKAKVDKCEFCRGGHDTSACPLLVGEEQVDFVGGGFGRGQPNRFAQNPNRGQGSLFGGGSNGQFNKGFNGQVKDGGSGSQVQPCQGSSYDLGGSLERMEAMMSQLVVRDQTTQKTLSEHDLMLKNHQASFQDLQRVVGDMSRKLEERLPGQFAGNPRVEERVVDEDGDIVDEEIEMEAPGKVQTRLSPASTAQPGESQGEKEVEKTPVDIRPSPLVDHSRVPFPSRLRNQKYSREYGQFLDIFKQLKINLPFIEALQSMPKYAKFLKDLLRNKEKLGELSNVPLNGGCFAVVLNKLPEKLTDLGVFPIPCLFGSNTNTKALADLGEGSELPVIISSKLEESEKLRLLEVLRANKEVIAWRLSDIKGISPSYCTHRILMEDDYKPVVQPQRRLNPNMQDVVKKEVLKLLDAGMIYPISDSPWVSPTQRREGSPLL
ncbi:uncharacterized protein LOC118492156 [Helianthus annuus]|uniref:uncharacterized protein LOC118492156 n=1 Tax=Helianthus annuus TaxID=4232 RepID=UPI001652C578|nr:uncharacterized protein LOC118492156 [Helianthus annuus]